MLWHSGELHILAPLALLLNIASLRSQSIKRGQWKCKLDYYGVVYAHLATGCGINAKDPRGWMQIGESRTRGVARIQPLGVFRYTICFANSSTAAYNIAGGPLHI